MHEIISICRGGGYMYCKTSPLHPKSNSNGLYPLHRVMLENKLGRYLLSTEVAHHIDGNKFNNTLENLMVLSNREHAILHLRKDEMINSICPCCGKEFQEKPCYYKLRQKRNKSGKVFCSRSCGVKQDPS